MNIRAGHIEIFVKDPIASKDFFEKTLGFSVTEIQHDKFVWMKLGDTEILLRQGMNKNQTEEYKDSNIAFVLYTNDIWNTKEELESRGLIFSGTDGSDSCLTFKDPNGNWFQITVPQHQ